MSRPHRARAGAAAVLLGASIAGASGAEPVFTDVTVAAGVDYVQYVYPVPLLESEPPYMSGGAAAGDFDGDGWVDLYATRLGQPALLFRNQGDGTFVDVAAAAGVDLPNANGAGWADIDNDGDLDLYVTTFFGVRHHLFVNRGDGTFSEDAIARGASIIDAEVHTGYSVAFGDVNRDGYLDLYVGEWEIASAISHARLLVNRGASEPGHFDDLTLASGLLFNAQFAFTPRFSDLDDDGWPDLAIAADFGTSKLLWNDGDGTFTNDTVAAGVGTDENGMGSAIGDYDGDGDLDWFVTSIFDPAGACGPPGAGCRWGVTGNRLYRNEGGRVFSDATDAAGVRDGYWGWGASFFDYDHDGDLDLAMTNGIDFAFVAPPLDQRFARFDPDPMRFWRNDGPAAPMTERSAAAGLTDLGAGKGLLNFDYDRDGDLDLFVVNTAGHPVLYRNDGGNAAPWLQVRLVGSPSNRQGIGARITVTPAAGGASQVRELDGGSHFLGQSEPIAHFGLGPAPVDSVHEVRVRWPSGAITTYAGVPANAVLVANEAAPPDADGDGVADAADNCPGTANPQQTDTGGVGAGSLPDGIGDACQCGDVTGDGRVTIADPVTLARALLQPPTAALARPELCDVGGGLGPGGARCTLADGVILRRALLNPASATIAPVCATPTT